MGFISANIGTMTANRGGGGFAFTKNNVGFELLPLK